jgi:hypothetical protein
MILVTLIFPDDQRRDSLLAAVPRVGDRIRLNNAEPMEPSLIVEQVMFVEANGNLRMPPVYVSVRKGTA